MTTAANISNKPISDELNPELLFNTTWNDLLVKIACGEIDCKQLAEKTLAGRGYNKTGKWVG